MTNFSIENKRILIIGASSGIGMELTKECHKNGAKLILTSRNCNALKTQLPKSIQNEALFIDLDVTNNNQISDLCKTIENIDGFVYTPGLVKLFPVQFIDENHLNSVRTPNFDGAVLLMSNLLRNKKINHNASLVFISSISSSFPYKGGAIYTSSKAALEAYSKTLALELSSKKIRSNCIKAGLVETKILEETRENLDDEIYNYHIKKYPLGLGKPIDVANTVLFLLSDASKWITGTEIILDGGLTAGA